MVYFAPPPLFSIITQGTPLQICKIIYDYLSEFFLNWGMLSTNIVEKIKSELLC